MYLGDNGKKICWKTPGAGPQKKEKKYIWVKDIVDIVEGREEKNFKKYKAVSEN